MTSAGVPLFSIVIPTYARARELRECLRSLTALEGDRSSFEVVIVDDGSPVPMDAALAGFEEALDVTVLRQENAGPAAARNAGASRARGKWIVFVDDDCLPASDYLVALARRAQAAPDCAIGGRTINALNDDPYATASQMLNDYLYGRYNADPERAQFLASNNMAMPVELFRRIGGFDTAFTRAAFEDRDLCRRLVQAGHRIIYAPEAVVYHAHHMTLRKYWRQHFTYGRGAASFHGVRRERHQGAGFEQPSFYLELLRYPLTRRTHRPVLETLALFALSQVATAAGFAREYASRWGAPASGTGA